MKLYKLVKKFGIKFTLRFILFQFKNKFGIISLKYLFLSTWHECNANCTHCYEKFSNKKKQQLSTQEIKTIIDQFYKLNGILIYFCSGEFLMRKDALELIEYARKKNILVCVVSNGLLLTDEYIKELKRVDLNRLVVSIDSANAEIHDKNRRVKGIFEKAINGLKKATEMGIKTQIWTYVSKSNFSELNGIAKLSKEISKEPVFVFFPLLSGHFFNKFDENLTINEREYFRKNFNNRSEIMLEFPEENSQCRGGGNEHINIMPDGEVTFCPPVPYSYGNVKKEDLKIILKRIKKDYNKFFKTELTGQCPVNFEEYRKNNSGKFIYE